MRDTSPPYNSIPKNSATIRRMVNNVDAVRNYPHTVRDPRYRSQVQKLGGWFEDLIGLDPNQPVTSIGVQIDNRTALKLGATIVVSGLILEFLSKRFIK